MLHLCFVKVLTVAESVALNERMHGSASFQTQIVSPMSVLTSVGSDS